MRNRILVITLCGVMVLGLLSVGGILLQKDSNLNLLDEAEVSFVYEAESELVVLEEEAVALSAAPPAVPNVYKPQQGDKVKSSQKASIDYSHVNDGYVMVKTKEQTGKRWKVQVKGPKTAYTYNLSPKTWTVFPMSDGNGSYQITVYENVTGTKYATELSQQCSVKLKDEFGPFLYSNQYVNYDVAPKAVKKAAELTQNAPTELDKVKAVYSYVVDNLSYDHKLAASVESGYLPVLDKVLDKKSGICFDYASLMTGMLRSQGVPCKLVVGYAGNAYHAWISVWTKSDGWIDGAIYFDGSKWQRMDPTFASSANKSSSIMQYIGDGKNYTAKYFY